MSPNQPPVSFDEIRALLKELPGPDEAAADLALARQEQLTKPSGSLGRLEEIAVWLARWQGRASPGMERPRTAVFVANHGIAAKGVSAYPQEVTQQMVQNFVHGGAAVNQLCSVADADLRVYEMALEKPTGDISEGPAMLEDDCARAIAYGLMAVEEGFDAMALGEMGIGNTTAASAVCLALFGGAADDWVGRGTGLDDAGLKRKTALVEQAVAVNRDRLSDPLSILCALGGQELAAIVGAILAARLARTPILLDGFVSTAAAAIVHKLVPGGLDHCLVAHRSAEHAHGRLVEELGKVPLLDLDMRLGEGSGATLAFLLLKAAVACHNGMATFDQAAVSRRSRDN
ncbi:nicotinate-nucleotide--dimethylbenzimidazole phosphoribosyltransferase [Limibacillus halophilus]|uniref:Nicotinate-nucleotide--dimethylbenzimidazole phosphoribosyltransferase n=1 Tax=Limibacillus halophilus TaxID=1579333 RepID=A0A839SUM6_9PROT|nr:nicotinate-nucleotide--dimethylbenzimidazole phosphoribosyltransferase [Limibacillus halophilus]MBB3066491.1 nicotinate-nucleotide--dimethylbenzimidazole phosphoribosyltransferase [Limibacillus halophilus]